MKTFMFAIKDEKLGFLTPAFENNSGIAVRRFSDLVRDNGSMFNLHPEDFSLWQLGTYETDTAEFDITLPLCVAKGVDFGAQV